MIRYVVAIILTVALIGVGLAGIDYAAGANSDQRVTASVTDFEDAAVSLLQSDELPPEGHLGPRRWVTVEMPDRSLTEKPVRHFEIRRVNDDHSVVAYRIGGGATQTRTIEVPITNVTGGNVVELGGGRDHELRLSLVRDDDDRALVQVVRLSEIDDA